MMDGAHPEQMAASVPAAGCCPARLLVAASQYLTGPGKCAGSPCMCILSLSDKTLLFGALLRLSDLATLIKPATDKPAKQLQTSMPARGYYT